MGPKMWSGVLLEEQLEPEQMLPAQYHDAVRRKRATAPEFGLVVSVLERAVLDLREFRYSKRRREQRLFMEAYKWIASDGRAWPFSFANLCEVLGLEPASVRGAILRDLRPTAKDSLFEHLPHVEEAA